uniref:Uncharacterized protein n=1 Tax=Amphimedon queenslandica TaxID=400682 RepID=A0A1X7V2D7_AMPQE
MGIYAPHIAIIDLSTDVFWNGMAYVALSRVRTLNELHSLSIDPLSVKLSNLSNNEINRLRSKFRKDLPQIKKSNGKNKKIQVTSIIDDGEPCSAKVKYGNSKKDVSFTHEEPPKPDIHYELREGIVSNIPNFEELFNSITIYSYLLTPTFVGWARYGTQTLYGIPCDSNTPALYLKHLGTNHFQAVKSINVS